MPTARKARWQRPGRDRSGLAGELKREAGSTAGRVASQKVAALSTSEVAGDGQAQARTPTSAGPRLLGSVEAVEEVWQVPWGDSGSAICHARLRPVVEQPPGHRYATPFRRVAHGVVQECGQDLGRLLRIAVHR